MYSDLMRGLVCAIVVCLLGTVAVAVVPEEAVMPLFWTTCVAAVLTWATATGLWRLQRRVAASLPAGRVLEPDAPSDLQHLYSYDARRR